MGEDDAVLDVRVDGAPLGSESSTSSATLPASCSGRTVSTISDYEYSSSLNRPSDSTHFDAAFSVLARDVSDRVLMFDGGQVVEDSDPEKIFTNPDHDRTRSFLHAVQDRG